MPQHHPTTYAADTAGPTITTGRLLLRSWQDADAEEALAVFGSDAVARWLAPAMTTVPDVAAMRDLLRRWNEAGDGSGRPVGRWAVVDRATGRLVGASAVLPLPPGGEDLEIGWQLAPDAWGRGYAAEAGHALAHYAFDHGEEELFAVVRPRNERGVATARRVGMEWVGETDKYYDLRLQVFRLRKGDLDVPAPRTGG
jgi:RimJ/RimL family protein N-acetyltransferase